MKRDRTKKKKKSIRCSFRVLPEKVCSCFKSRRRKNYKKLKKKERIRQNNRRCPRNRLIRGHHSSRKRHQERDRLGLNLFLGEKMVELSKPDRRERGKNGLRRERGKSGLRREEGYSKVEGAAYNRDGDIYKRALGRCGPQIND